MTVAWNFDELEYQSSVHGCGEFDYKCTICNLPPNDFPVFYWGKRPISDAGHILFCNRCAKKFGVSIIKDLSIAVSRDISLRSGGHNYHPGGCDLNNFFKEWWEGACISLSGHYVLSLSLFKSFKDYIHTKNNRRETAFDYYGRSGLSFLPGSADGRQFIMFLESVGARSCLPLGSKDPHWKFSGPIMDQDAPSRGDLPKSITDALKDEEGSHD